MAGKQNPFVWYELMSSDVASAKAFYTGVVGWTAQDVPMPGMGLLGWLKGDSVDMGPMGIYQLFNIGSVPSGAMFNDPTAKAAPFWLYYFNVGDIDAGAKRVTDGGGKIMQGAHQVPGGNWIVHAADPQGAAFALLGSKK
jgi:uncharacterized protein